MSVTYRGSFLIITAQLQVIGEHAVNQQIHSHKAKNQLKPNLSCRTTTFHSPYLIRSDTFFFNQSIRMMHFKFSALPNVCVLLCWNDKFEHSPQIFRHIFISGNYMRVQPGHDLNPLTYLDGYLQCSQMGSIWHYKVNTSTVFKVWHLHFHEQLRLLMSSKIKSCSAVKKSVKVFSHPSLFFIWKFYTQDPI